MKDFKKIIAGHEYYVIQLSADAAFSQQLKLVELFGESMVSSMATGNSDIAGVAGGIIGSISRNGSEKVREIVSEVVCQAKRDGERINSIASTYQTVSELAEMYAVFAWVLQANYSDFFEAAKDLFSDPKNYSV